MQRQLASRLLLASVIIFTGVVVVAVIPAGAVKFKKPAVKCTTFAITSTPTGFSGKLSDCSDVADTGGEGTLNYNLTSVPNETTITWAKHYGTTVVTVLLAQYASSKICPKTFTEFDVGSVVDEGTGKAASIPRLSLGQSKLCSKWSGWPAAPPEPLPWRFLGKSHPFEI